MSERVFPSSKPPAAVAAAPAAANGGTGRAPAATTTTTTNGGTTKAHLYNPTARPPYRPQPHNRRHHHRPRRNYCCCCCFWTILIILILTLLVAITGTVLYVLYRPHRPSFTLTSLRIHRLNLTTTADSSSSSHLSTLFNLTLSSKNPNSHLSFSYDPIVVSCVSSNSDVFIGNGTLPAFVSNSKNETTFRGVVVTTSSDLDADTVNNLRPDLKKKNGILLKVQMDTRVTVKISGLKSKKVGIRVTCDGIKGVVPKGKSPSVANVSGSKCKVDLRIKIWKWTF